MQSRAETGHCSGTPNRCNLSEKYWQCTSNLYRSTPPICNAVPCRLLSLEERETPQCASYLYRNTPPICTAVRLPFVPALLFEKSRGFQTVPSRNHPPHLSHHFPPHLVTTIGSSLPAPREVPSALVRLCAIAKTLFWLLFLYMILLFWRLRNKAGIGVSRNIPCFKPIAF